MVLRDSPYPEEYTIYTDFPLPLPSFVRFKANLLDDPDSNQLRIKCHYKYFQFHWGAPKATCPVQSASVICLQHQAPFNKQLPHSRLSCSFQIVSRSQQQHTSVV